MTDSFPHLEALTTPDELRSMPIESLERLAVDIRRQLISLCMTRSAHFASNLGIVELSIALHSVFDFKSDQLIFDVGHQVYPHKLLTGRFNRFETIRLKDGLSGYPEPDESDYDPFRTGHASSSLSTALGLAVGLRDQKPDARVVAVIGDGSMSGGLAYEGLNNAGGYDGPLIFILNDNAQSISPSVGSLNEHLSALRESTTYNRFRYAVKRALGNIPLIGSRLQRIASATLDAVHRLVTPKEIFSALGFRYFGPIDGHDIAALKRHLARVKKVERPAILHVYTQKGYGYKPALDDPTRYHAPKPADMSLPVETNGDLTYVKPAVSHPSGSNPSGLRFWSDVIGEKLVSLGQADPRVCAITAAMPDGTKTSLFRTAFPDRFFDVGIAEQHAVAFAAGLAKAGRRPFVMIYSTFLQRSYDQVFQELSLQRNLPVVLGLDRAGLVGDDGPTHHGVFDIAYLRGFPNLVLAAPKDSDEALDMLDAAMTLDATVAIRYPRDYAPDFGDRFARQPIVIGKGETLINGERVALLAYGAMVERAVDASDIVFSETGVRVSVVNARFAKPLDLLLIKTLLDSHDRLLTIEDHQIAGGFGSAVLEALAADSHPGIARVETLGIPDRYIPHASRSEQLKSLGLDAAGIAARVRARLSD